MPARPDEILNQTDMRGFRAVGDPAAGDRTRPRALPGFGGVELFDADFRNFVFEPHTHDTLMLGLILVGEKRFERGGREHAARAGAISIVNPGQTHTGGVARSGARLVYWAAYPSAAMMRAAGLPQGADLADAVSTDRVAAAWLARALAPGVDPFDAEEALLIGLRALARRSVAKADISRWRAAALRRAVDFIEADPARAGSIEEVAAAAEVSPRHLLRAFRRELGLTPRAYVRQARVRLALAALRSGAELAQAALKAGFSDQAHLTRAVRGHIGVTPAAYRRAWSDLVAA